MTDNHKRIIFIAMAVAAIAAIAIAFFTPDIFEGRTLQQHDIRQGIANGQEVQLFEQQTGETSRWTNSLFSGMPNFQIAPSYSSNAILGWLQTLFGLGLPSPANLLFMLMAGFFAMCLCMKMRWPLALFAAIAWGFSTYFVIIIGAGHIWKFVTLAYVPPTIGGLVLLYRGRYLAGTAMTSLFASMQLMSNHPQMSYYFFILMLCLVVAFGVIAYRDKQPSRFWSATGLAMLAGMLALAVNSASLYNSYEYSKETVRGKSTMLTEGDTSAEHNQGMDRNAITAWSYGLDETFTLLIPNVKGGATIKPTGTDNHLLALSETDAADKEYLSPQEMQFLSQFPQYFGDQPMTNGPVYVGAIVLLLAILALFIVDDARLSPVKWALFAASILSILLAWGHNFPLLTDFFIDHIPGYNKFRAPASILVVLEFCVPLLAAMALHKICTEKDFLARYKWTLICVFGGGAIICFLGWVAPEIFGQPFSISERNQLAEMGILNNPDYANIIGAIRRTRLSLVSADSLRSLIYILIGTGILFLYLKGAFKSRQLFVGALTALVLIDLFSVNKRYVDTDNFNDPVAQSDSFYPTAGDETILADKDENFRVADMLDFNGARSSYFHKTIGGYHAAKLTRYNDLLTHAITPAIQRQLQAAHYAAEAAQRAENDSTDDAADAHSAAMPQRLFTGDEPILDMLNVKYYLYGDYAERNHGAYGNAWLVERIDYQPNPVAEMAALIALPELRATATAEESQREILGAATAPTPGDTIFETSYAPNRLTYKARSAKGGVAVFSEVFFPWGWEATIDGNPVKIARADYTLRAMRIPAGEHEIVMTFRPKSLEVTNAAGIAGCVVIYLLIAAAIALPMIRRGRAAKHDKSSTAN